MLYSYPTESATAELIEVSSGELVYDMNPSTIQIINPYTGNIRLNLTGHTLRVLRFAYLSQLDILASSAWDSTIKLWNVTTGELIKSWQAYNTYALKMVEMSNGDLVSAGGSSDPTVKRWSAENNFELNITVDLTATRPAPAFIRLKNGYLALGDNNQNLYIVDPTDLSVMKQITNAFQSIPVIVELENGDIAVSGNENVIRIWSGADYTLKKVVNSNSSCKVLTCLPGNHLACATAYGIYVLNLDNDELVQNLTAHTGLVFGMVMMKSGDLASISPESLKIWRWEGK